MNTEMMSKGTVNILKAKKKADRWLFAVGVLTGMLLTIVTASIAIYIAANTVY